MQSTVSKTSRGLRSTVRLPVTGRSALYPLPELDSVRFRFQTIELGGEDFHLRSLRDVQQCPTAIDDMESLGISSATWPLFGVLWQSEELLSHLMVTEDVRDKRVLELGCGLALASLVLKRRGFDVTATDLNPYARVLLNFNTSLNGIDCVEFGQAGWSGGNSSLGHFDLLLASDVLYDHHNLEPLVSFLAGHVRPDGEILLVDPGRGLTRRFARAMTALGFSVAVQSTQYETRDGQSKSYWVLRSRKLRS